MQITDLLEFISSSKLSVLFFPLNPVILILIVILIVRAIKYRKTSYYQITKIPYLSVKKDIGKYGEYLIYKRLKNFEEKNAKFLFNVYIPKEDEQTTECDVLMLTQKGIFVFESKNYSGWIFGSEKQKNWYQTLPSSKGKSHKEHFYNPIMQNNSHIKHLKELIATNVPIYSVIVFSERCTLKSINITSDNIKVIKRDSISYAVNEILDKIPNNLLNENEVTDLYNKLYPYTQVSEKIKKEHIENIKKHTEKEKISSELETTQTVNTASNAVSLPEKSQQCVENSEDDISQPNNETDQSDKITTDLTANENVALKCPKCNGDLVLRTAKKGVNAGKQFLGCSNYPKCKYIKNQ